MQTLKEFEELKWIEPPKLENAILPVVKEVEFKSREGRRVPGYLLTPDECSKLDPRPAVIFLHGGSFASFGNTQKVFTTQNNETRLFVQFGNVVFLPGYYGDCYFGTEFREKTPRFVDKERFRPQLEDVAEALRFIRGLPCVDTKKIAIIGHSYGAMIGAVFATSSQNFGQDQIKFIVLRGGIYDEKGIKEFTDFQIEKVAFPEGDAARKYLSVASLKERGVPLFYPSSGIESVDDALKIHAELETEKFYGVYYRLSQSFYEEVTPVNRAPHIRPDLPVYIYHGLKDHVQTAYSFEVAIKKYSHKVHSWYPDDGHTFSGDIQIEMVKRIQAVLTN